MESGLLFDVIAEQCYIKKLKYQNKRADQSLAGSLPY